MPELDGARSRSPPREDATVNVSSARAASTSPNVIRSCRHSSIGPSWLMTFIPWRWRSPPRAGTAATQSAAANQRIRLIVIAPPSVLRPSFLQQLHQVVGGFLVATHDGELLDRLLLHLRVLLGPRDLD